MNGVQPSSTALQHSPHAGIVLSANGLLCAGAPPLKRTTLPGSIEVRQLQTAGRQLDQHITRQAGGQQGAPELVLGARKMLASGLGRGPRRRRTGVSCGAWHKSAEGVGEHLGEVGSGWLPREDLRLRELRTVRLCPEGGQEPLAAADRPSRSRILPPLGESAPGDPGSCTRGPPLHHASGWAVAVPLLLGSAWGSISGCSMGLGCAAAAGGSAAGARGGEGEAGGPGKSCGLPGCTPASTNGPGMGMGRGGGSSAGHPDGAAWASRGQEPGGAGSCVRKLWGQLLGM